MNSREQKKGIPFIRHAFFPNENILRGDCGQETKVLRTPASCAVKRWGSFHSPNIIMFFDTSLHKYFIAPYTFIVQIRSQFW
jgi:hypothetical protein